ncbi:SpoIID/LytB domain-containing protein [Halothermothrix orenii]|uniref:SpoIID/LytB domain protein n=1 Tax=Halothermothrix orenii (strain H 168 / OCM 544 / DSM 9562) TaxID=373903 RepID=B8CX30_HALOH|nr:SpoIID/LytB domain-containing protein [Halothermothrix orenii]ACL69849.1 SpoIID/LytB domain protein [Halothermothrix orenii H 168]
MYHFSYKNTLIILVAMITFVTMLISIDGERVSGLTKLLETDLTDFEIHNLYKKARTEYYNGNPLKAYDLYKTIHGARSKDLRSLKNLVTLSEELGQYEDTLFYLNRLINLEPENIYWKYKKGQVFYQSARYESAYKLLYDTYQLLNQNNNKNGQILSNKEKSLLNYYLGKIHQLKGETDKAKKHFQNGIKLYSDLPLNYMGLAGVFKNERQYKKAVYHYKLSLSRDYSLSFIYPELAILMEKLNNYEDAYYYWKKSLATGNSTNRARKKITFYEENYPAIIKKEESEKEKKRENIYWRRVEPVYGENIPELRIGLVEGVKSISFQASSDFAFVLKGNNKPLLQGNANTEWSVKREEGTYFIFKEKKLIRKYKSNKPLVIKSNKHGLFLLYDLAYGKGYFWADNEDRQFRGALEAYPVNDGFNLINIVNVEAYLLSVVPSEMPAWWPHEALKTQAVAARSYALAHLNRHKDDGYNLCAEVHCAAYRGVEKESPRTTKAILETMGEVITYHNRIIDAVFSSNSGGFSESSYDIWGSKLPYLPGSNNMIDNNIEFPLDPYKLERWLITDTPSYSNNPRYSPNNSYRWVKYLPIGVLEEKLNIKDIINIIPLEKSKGGSVLKLKITGRNKSLTLSGGRIRSYLGGLRSSRFLIKKIYSPEGTISSLILYGGGWGHNVGLDQTAAASMADEGFNYKQILKHFYKETEIKKLYE